MKKIFLILLTSLIAAAPTFADDASKKAVATELYDLMSPKDTVIDSFMASFEPYMQQIAQMGVPKEAVDQIRAEGKALAGKIAEDPELVTKMIAIYMDTFSEAELKDLIAFYKTPTGKKALQELPTLFQKGAVAGEEIAQKYLPEFQTKVQQIMEKAMMEQMEAAPAQPAVPSEAAGATGM
ncbi:DUF2059 domain-containing protein [Cerasicoccus fimbriatus]|uniref:DUF2059 domain-containing protein n=1 Tax=Cerasicoccus fimbriatus TaxID=3014554 RepID=UPI0022B43F48|nr:DUF2059 domain-containing protein [Cerasicoccus sp. TK19100]